MRRKDKAYGTSLLISAFVASGFIFPFEAIDTYLTYVILGGGGAFGIGYMLSVTAENMVAEEKYNDYTERFTPSGVFIGVLMILEFRHYLYPKELTFEPLFPSILIYFALFLGIYKVSIVLEKLIRKKFQPYIPEELY